MMKECTNVRFLTQEYAGKSIALPNIVQSKERKFNSGFGVGQGTHRSTWELQCEREGQWLSPKAESLLMKQKRSRLPKRMPKWKQNCRRYSREMQNLYATCKNNKTLLRRNAYVLTDDQGFRPRNLPTSPQNCWQEDKGRRYS